MSKKFRIAFGGNRSEARDIVRGTGFTAKSAPENSSSLRHSEAHSQSAKWLQKTRRSAGLFCNYVGTFNANENFQAKESSLLQYKAVAKNENNSTETNLFTHSPIHLFTLKRAAFTLAEGATHVAHCDKSRRVAFTLAEVLITLGIIGVVAALTLPSIINKVQNIVLKNQFKKAYSNLQNAINLVQKDEPIACWYWDHNPYPLAECISWNEYGTCIGWSTLPPDYSGMTQDCNTFYENLRKALNTIKYCENNALKNGCITDAYRGIDKVEADKNPDVKQDPDQIFSDNNIKTKYRVFITSDNVLYMHWDQQWPWFAFDINGHKGPNKWGHDIFTFSIVGNKIDGITKIDPTTYPVDKGGKTMSEMINLP